jgi:protein-S-isoprenylcysteine O-methyltransferase Ste14
MFLAAGKINYFFGWIYFTLSIFGLIINIVTTQNNPDLLSERSTPKKNVPAWDKKILGLLALLTIISYIAAGLDSGRFNWSPLFNIKLYLFGVFLIALGQIIFAIAKYQNNFFSSMVRIQTDRHHTVCDTGLYKFIRHPGYFGMILSWLGFPIVLNSIYSILPVLLSIILIIVRTNLEDKLLSQELKDYYIYKKKTKYRLFPLIW